MNDVYQDRKNLDMFLAGSGVEVRETRLDRVLARLEKRTGIALAFAQKPTGHCILTVTDRLGKHGLPEEFGTGGNRITLISNSSGHFPHRVVERLERLERALGHWGEPEYRPATGQRLADRVGGAVALDDPEARAADFYCRLLQVTKHPDIRFAQQLQPDGHVVMTLTDAKAKHGLPKELGTHGNTIQFGTGKKGQIAPLTYRRMLLLNEALDQRDRGLDAVRGR